MHHNGDMIWCLRGGCFLWVANAIFTLSVCTTEGAPGWAANAIWYQIFPERFRNGDSSNDPVPASLEGTWPYYVPEGWGVMPWTADWYALQPWERADGKGFYVHAQLRRYGGDLQGIIDSLDYLKRLGVNALYLNPVFESASLHKYGATLFHHVDKHFGPDPAGDLKLFGQENPADPTTWHWSAADRLFLKLVAEAHSRQMRIIIDGVFNHVGIPFWAFQRAWNEGPSSPFAKWFHIRRWDDPVTPQDKFDYQGWAGVKDLPEFAKDEHGPSPNVKSHLRAVVRRWMDPNGDGDPADGIDGWRLDVAAELSLAFWKEFHGWVQAINPQAYLTGEIWWEDYDKLTFRNARPWLDQGFDGVMNYRFGDAVFQFFNQPKAISASEFTRLTSSIHEDYGYGRALVLQNLYGSHDTSRVGSAVVNPRYRQDHGANVAENRDYQIRKPRGEEKRRWKQMVMFQFLAPGAPYIYYGDEVGMWGADDPDCRKPMVWSDLGYQPERSHPFDLPRPTDSVAVDRDLFRFYQECAKLRRRHTALRLGDFEWTHIENRSRVVAFRRSTVSEEVIAIFNADEHEAKLPVRDLQLTRTGGWRDLISNARLRGEQLTVPPSGFRVLHRQRSSPPPGGR
jgi:glycosidase